MTVLLILTTWVLWVIAALGWGTFVLGWLRLGLSGRAQWQAGLWLGLGLILVVAAAVQLLVGIGHTPGAALAAFILVGGVVLAAIRLARQMGALRASLSLPWRASRLPVLGLLLLLAIGLISMANLATGEPMDADAGSYRIGSILYAADYPVVPGLGNLHFRFGFNSTLWPFAALVGSGPWSDQGYRLVTGVFLTTMIADLILRIVIPRRSGSTPGDWFMVIAICFTGGVILTDAGRWVPSPGQDIAILAVSVASTAFLADFVRRPVENSWTGGMSIVTAVIAGSIRPLGWVLAVVTFVVVASIQRIWLGWPWPRVRRASRASGAWLVIVAAVMAARDALLTGWILYPLTALPLPVRWITTSGQAAAEGITAYARAPGEDQVMALTSHDWVEPWASSFFSSREVFFLRLILLGAAATVAWTAGRRAWRRSHRPLLAAMIPSAVMLVVWFWSAPDVRFGWTALIGVAALPGAFLLAAGAYPRVAAKSLAVFGLAAMMATQVLNGRLFPRGGEAEPEQWTIGPIAIAIHLAPPPTPGVVKGELGDGTPIVFPSGGGNCYDIFPLCLIPGTGGDVESLGDSITDGFGVIERLR